MRIRWCSAMGRTAAVLALAALWLAPAAADEHLQELSDELQANLTEMLSMSNLTFHNKEFPVLRVFIPEQEPFQPRGMGTLYNVTPVVMDTIVKKERFIPEGFINVSDGNLEVQNVSWRQVVQYHPGPITFVFCFVLFAMLLPISGLVWCCCHMCRGRRRRRPFDRKYDGCLKAILAILLIALLTLFLFGVVCSFATEQQLEEGIGKLGGGIRTSMGAVRRAINDTTFHVKDRVEGYAALANSSLGSAVLGVMSAVSQGLGLFSNAVAVTSLNQVVERLDDVQRDLREVQQLTATLRFQAGLLNTGLRKVKRNLLQTLANCDTAPCVNLQRKHRIGELNTDIQYSQMPDVSELLNNVTALLDGHIQEDVADGQRVFDDLKDSVLRTFNDSVPRLRQALDNIGGKMTEFADEVRKQGEMVYGKLERVERDTVGQLDDARRDYGPYRRYLGLGIAWALLTITLVLALGLLCGVCGKRPDAYGGADCCNKGKGSCCLYLGMVLMFVLGAVFCAATVGYFATGVLLQRLVCDPLTEPRNNTVFEVIDKFADPEKKLFKHLADPESNFTATNLFVSCNANHTIYHMLNVPRIWHVSMMRRALQQEVSLHGRQLQPAFPARRIVLLRDSAKRKLRALADSGLSEFPYDRILSALESNMTSLELPVLARTLARTADSVAERRGYGAVPDELRAAAKDLHELHRDIVTPMQRHAHTLNETAHRLKDSLRFNHTSLKQAVSQLLQETQDAEDFLNEKGAETARSMLNMASSMLGNSLIGMIDAVMDKEVLGRCGPYSRAINDTRDSVCNDILLPLNGFWVSLGYCVLLLAPLLLVSARLARLYLQQDPYPGPLIEAEYLYDAYADRDNVPLANGSKRSTLDIEGKIAEWRERSAPSAPSPSPPGAGGVGGAGSASALLVGGGGEVVCALLPPAALLDDLKTRLDAKDEDNESGIHEADAYKADKRHRGERDARGRGVCGGAPGACHAVAARGQGEAAALAPPLDAHHARRYNDMAPKHWEEGPPRYHGPATEYERPPPYYYPGPNDRQ